MIGQFEVWVVMFIWRAASSSSRRSAAATTRRVRSTASGLTEIDVMPKRTRCSANSGRFDGAWPHSDEVMPGVAAGAR